ncbi:MAG TPA: hypothetical protein VJH33_01810 [Candidatus Paceibacterota bacterium]
MIIFSIVVFVLSFLGIVTLFVFKYMEEKRGAVAFELRDRADVHARRLKQLLSKGGDEFAKFSPRALFLVRTGVHTLALSTAYVARTVEGGAHRLADLVSHKHGFERRETKSEFLKKVGESKGIGEHGS